MGGQLDAGPQQVEPENVPIEGSLETSHLLEQIEALRGTVRFLRTENSYLKGYDLLKEIETLPELRFGREALVASDTDESDGEDGRGRGTVFSLSTETKKLYRDVMAYSSGPRVVDLSVVHAKRAGGKVWLPRKEMAGAQVVARRQEGERLRRRVEGLRERARELSLKLY